MSDQEIIAKALEISIALTGANHESLHSDERGDVYVNNTLFNTMQTVIRILKAKNIVDERELGECRVFPDDTK